MAGSCNGVVLYSRSRPVRGGCVLEQRGALQPFYAMFSKNESSPKNKTTPRTTSMMSTLSRRERGTTTRSLYIMVGKVGRNREVKQSEITR